MTPEELKQAFEDLKSTYKSFAVLYLILSPVLSAAAVFAVSYLKKKGENLAEKEDIEAITEIVESVKEDVRFIGKRQEIHYSYFFQEKAKTLSTIYGRLSALQRDLSSAVRDSLAGSGQTEAWYTCRDQIWETKYLIDDSKIFLEKDLELKLYEIIDGFMKALESSGVSKAAFVNVPDLLVKAVKKALDDSGPQMRIALDELATAFREHIREPRSE